MACLYFPNGVWRPSWFPEKTGSEYEITPSLQPLAHHRENMLVFSGLDKKHSHGGDGHYVEQSTHLRSMLQEDHHFRNTLSYE
jgi:hypothetical protein